MLEGAKNYHHYRSTALLTMRYLKVPGIIFVSLFVDRSNSNKFCCPLKLSSVNDEILFVDKSANGVEKTTFSFYRFRSRPSLANELNE